MAKPEVERYGDILLLRWPSLRVAAEVSSIHRDGRGLQAEVTWRAERAGQLSHLHWASVTLSSTSSRNSMIKELEGRSQGLEIEWHDLMEQVAVLGRNASRGLGEPVDLSNLPPSAPLRFRIEKLCQENQLTLVYGEREAGKSLLAEAAAYAVADGNDSLLGLTVEPGIVRVLDWETDQETYRQRLEWLARGMGGFKEPALLYHHMERPLVELAPELRREGDRLNVSLDIIDSLGPACGGDLNKPEIALAFVGATRALGHTILAIAQTTKEETGGRRRRFRVFGSIMYEYMARAIWFVRSSSEPETQQLDLGLYHEKHNNTPRFRPFGYHFHIDQDKGAIRISGQDIRRVPELAEGLGLAERISALLGAGPREAFEIAEEMGCTEAVARGILNRHKDRFTKTLKGWALLERDRVT
jgi:hypothetical protein